MYHVKGHHREYMRYYTEYYVDRKCVLVLVAWATVVDPGTRSRPQKWAHKGGRTLSGT